MMHALKGRQARRVTHPKKRKRTPEASSLPRSLWLLIGAFVGVLGLTYSYLLFSGQPLTLLSSSQKKVSKSSKIFKSRKSAPPKATASGRFEFYQLLPGMEVPIPDPATELSTQRPDDFLRAPVRAPSENQALLPVQASKIPPAAQSRKPAPPPLPKVESKIAAAQYLIQAGAYRALDSAEHFKSKLKRLGFNSRIQKVEAEDGTWFRIIVGPFPSDTVALQHKKNLAKQKINSILILQRQ